MCMCMYMYVYVCVCARAYVYTKLVNARAQVHLLAGVWAWPVVAWRVTILVPLITPSITPMTEVGQAERTAVTHIMH